MAHIDYFFIFKTPQPEKWKVKRNVQFLSGEAAEPDFKIHCLTIPENEYYDEFEFLIVKYGEQVNGRWNFLNSHNGYHFFWRKV